MLPHDVLSSPHGEKSRLTRRGFIESMATAAASAGLLLGGEPARAIEPIARTGTSNFKFSLAAYSYRDLLTGKSERIQLDDFITDCARMRLQGTELTSYYFPQPLTPEYLRHIKELCFRLGLDVSGTAIGNDFCVPPGAARDEQIKNTKRWIDHAEILGAPVIRIFSGQAKDQDQATATKLAIEGMEECCQYAGERGIYLALENHHGLTTKADDMLAMVKAVKSPWFGVNLDTGNFHTDDIYGDLAKLRAVCHQCAGESRRLGTRRQETTRRFRPARQDAQCHGLSRLYRVGIRGARRSTRRLSAYMEQLRKAFVSEG